MGNNTASIIHFDKEPGWRRHIESAAGLYGHSIVAAASSHEQADEIMDRVESGDLKADVVVFDNNLKGPGTITALLERARAIKPPLRVVLLPPENATPLELEGLVDHRLERKGRFSPEGIRFVLDEIMAQKDPAATGAPIPS